MNDFRIQKIKNVAESLGMQLAFYSVEDNVLAYSNGFYFKFEEKGIKVNAICLHVPSEKENLISMFCKMISPKFQNVDFAVCQSDVYAFTDISNSIFIRDDSSNELQSVVKDILEDTISGTNHIMQLL